MDGRSIRELFVSLDVEKKGYLTEEQKEAFVLHSKILGWRYSEDKITEENVEEKWKEAFILHREIEALIKTYTEEELLHVVHSSLSVHELQQIIKWMTE